MRFFLFLLSAVLAAVSGCMGDGLAEVSGTVTMDGQPLKDGEIILESTDQKSTPAGSKISEGAYTMRTTPGPKVVRILASRPTSKPDPVMGSAAREAAIGPEYNTKSTLRAAINPGKQAGLDFQVKELPKKP
ncbi:MAG: hypothetical protein FJ261_14265 [Planctomycetes bacterium]|nr:hypothetical protein [Planctomycetota bacterium]